MKAFRTAASGRVKEYWRTAVKIRQESQSSRRTKAEIQERAANDMMKGDIGEQEEAAKGHCPWLLRVENGFSLCRVL